MFLRHCSVCASTFGASAPVVGSTPPWPETNTSRSNPIPGEYGPTGGGRFAARTGVCDISASLHRPRRVGRPLAPRSDVQLRAAQAGVLEREQIVARGDAGSAVADDAIHRRRP